MMTERNHDLRAFAIGAAGYSLIELLVRRRTHWTMAVTGGVCFMLMHKICRRRKARTRLYKCAVSAALITGMEFVVGVIVNRALKWAVWDYSDRPLNVMGQICPRFSFYWFLMGLPIVWLSDKLSQHAVQSPQR